MRRLLLPALLAFAAASFLTGINWGLPSRWADPFLFAGRPPWTGDRVMRLAGDWAPAADRGSDRPQHAAATTAPSRATVVNATDTDRAEIVRRYRLYSAQPDEMITFRALSRLHPGRLDLDPRLYQYGGLWIYPVGGLLKLASVLHLVRLDTRLAFYLDHPDAFARFYVVARLYSTAWGLVGVVVVFGLTRELTGRALAAATAAGVYAAMPVVVNAAHEAKPHLAGTVLTLAAAWAAAAYVRTGRRWWPAAVLAGAAAGTVLTGVAAWAVLPVMAGRRWRVTAASLAVAAGVFAATNPYLPIDALLHRDRLASNVGNYGSFYGPSAAPATLWNAARLVVEGTSPVIAIVALVGLVVTGRAGTVRHRSPPGEARPTWIVLAAPVAVVAAQFALLASHKPAEYARFALTLDVTLAILAASAITRLPLRPREATLAGALLVATAALFGMRYDLNYLADAGPRSTRRTTARQLAALAEPGRTLSVPADPAPYGLPPVDLWAWRIVVGPDVPPGAVTVRPTDVAPGGLASPISWADKPFAVIAPPRPSR